METLDEPRWLVPLLQENLFLPSFIESDRCTSGKLSSTRKMPRALVRDAKIVGFIPSSWAAPVGRPHANDEVDVSDWLKGSGARIPSRISAEEVSIGSSQLNLAMSQGPLQSFGWFGSSGPKNRSADLVGGPAGEHQAEEDADQGASCQTEPDQASSTSEDRHRSPLSCRAASGGPGASLRRIGRDALAGLFLQQPEMPRGEVDSQLRGLMEDFTVDRFSEANLLGRRART